VDEEESEVDPLAIVKQEPPSSGSMLDHTNIGNTRTERGKRKTRDGKPTREIPSINSQLELNPFKK
jgi:hypothetical protein